MCRSQATTLSGADKAIRVGLGAHGGQQQAQVAGFKMRALAAGAIANETQRWLYTMDWCCYGQEASAAALDVNVLAVSCTHVGALPHPMAGASVCASGRWHAAVFAACRSQASTRCTEELQVVSMALSLLQAHAAAESSLPVWLCTVGTQAVPLVSTSRNAGLWGFARACRREMRTLAAWCVDVDGSRGLAAAIQSSSVRLQHGSVRGLQLSSSVEPEAALAAGVLQVHLSTDHVRQRGVRHRACKS